MTVNFIDLRCPRCDVAGTLTAPDKMLTSFLCAQCGEIPIEEFKSQTEQGRTTKPDDYNLSEHPEHAMALGMLIAAWARVEHALCETMSFLMRTPIWNIQGAYYAIVSNSARIAAIRGLAPTMVGAIEFQAPLTELLDRARALADRRNGYAHKMWSLSTDGKDVYLVENIGALSEIQTRKVQPSEMHDTTKQIMELASDLRDFLEKYSAAHAMYATPEDDPDAVRARFVRRKRRMPTGDPSLSGGDCEA